MQSRVNETVFRRFFRLSIPAVDCCSSMWCVCCCGPSRHVISIDYCTAWLQQVCPPFSPYLQQSAANASCVLFPATVEGWTQTCDFMFILLYMLWLSGASAACVSISFVCTLHCLSDYVGRTSLKLPVCVECNVKPLTRQSVRVRHIQLLRSKWMKWVPYYCADLLVYSCQYRFCIGGTVGQKEKNPAFQGQP